MKVENTNDQRHLLNYIIINKIRLLKLPLKVTSASLQLNYKIKEFFEKCEKKRNLILWRNIN